MSYFIQYNFPCGHVASYKRVKAPPKPAIVISPIVETVTASWPLYCDDCFDRMEYEITTRHLQRHFNLLYEAVRLGWRKSDVAGSLLDIREELGAEIQDFRTVFGQPRQPDDFPYYLVLEA